MKSKGGRSSFLLHQSALRIIGMSNSTPRPTLRAGMVGMGMIFDETYRPFFERAHREGLYERSFADVDVPLAAVATRTGRRAESYKSAARANGAIADFASFSGNDAVDQMLTAGVDFACVATPDDRHFEAARKIVAAGVHLLVEKPSVLSLQELDELVAVAREKNVLAKVVYHKLLDPDHKKLRTLVHPTTIRPGSSTASTVPSSAQATAESPSPSRSTA